MIELDRRTILAAGAGSLAVSSIARTQRGPDDALLDDVERRMFAFFWDTGRADNGLVPDRWPSPSFCSIAAVGFALTAYPYGVERGWVSRGAAARRTLATLRFFHDAPQGPEARGKSGHKGFFYHFIDMKTGLRFRDTELSTVDSTLLFLGMLFAAEWFDRDTPEEKEIRRLADAIVERADWRWFQRGRDDISMGWHPERGFIERGWTGYNEGMMVVLLALGAKGFPVGERAWDAWTSTYRNFWRGSGATRRLGFAPLFGHQYSHCWIDFRGIRDAVMREAGFDYFENSRRAVQANWAYCAANPMGWRDYSRTVWGLTACDGPGGIERRIDGKRRRFNGYSARGPLTEPEGFDDGTLAPTAVMGSMPFAPELCIPGIAALRRTYGSDIYGKYGFLDAFNPTFRDTGVKLETGSIRPRAGWVATDYLGIDQGAALVMMANHRSGTIWKRMRRSATLRRGLVRAGFTGGWIEHGEKA